MMKNITTPSSGPSIYLHYFPSSDRNMSMPTYYIVTRDVAISSMPQGNLPFQGSRVMNNSISLGFNVSQGRKLIHRMAGTSVKLTLCYVGGTSW